MKAAHVMARTITVVIGLLISTAAHAQAVDDTWEMRARAPLNGYLSSWNGPAGCDTTALTNAELGGLARVLIYLSIASKSGDPSSAAYYVVVLQRNNQGSQYAEVNHSYCIKQSALRENFVLNESHLAGGVLSVPFKLRFSPTKIMAGGALGGFIGYKLRHTKDIASMPLVFASLTNVPLNDMNEKVPQTQWGLGFGLGWVVTIPNDFQAGVVIGWDIFSWPDDWPYKKSPWLSISIGYSFISPQRQNAAQAAAMAAH